ncbi:MAG: nucleotide exchange factor GrpE [Chloroflexota bacterium]
MSDKKHKSKEQENETAAETTEKETTAANEDVNTIKTQLNEAAQKAQEYLDALQRERASFMNFRRRTEQENALVGRVASGSTIKKFLSGIDDLERALAHRPADEPWADGIELVYRKFLSILEAEGVTRMQVEGQHFNPELHEAIMQEQTDKYESGVVTMVLQQGYMHGDKVLRPALVKVAQ